MPQFLYKRQAIEDLVPGMVLGKMIVTNDGKNFLNEGAILTLRIIQTLQIWGFRYVDIREEVKDSFFSGMEVIPREQTGESANEYFQPESTGGLTSDNLSQSLRGPEDGVKAEPEAELDVPQVFQENYHAAVQVLKKNLSMVRFIKEGFDISDIRRMANECVLPLLEDASVIDNLQMMAHSEDYLYHHSADVGIISGCLGLWLGRSFREIEEIVLGALLHDLGKALIPLNVLNKPGTLTEEEMNLVRFHSTRGYKFLVENRDVPRSVLLCVLQHHERIDGSGYPLSVQGAKIHPYAKIIAVADVFNAITSVRNYGRIVTPYEAVEILRHEMIGKLDSQASSVFVEKISQRFLGDVVQLSNGQRGEVVFINSYDSARPIVRTSEGEFVDLAKNRDVAISKMLHS